MDTKKKNREKTIVAKLQELGYNEVTEGYAGVVELADTLDSKSSEAYPSCGFKSHLRHQAGISYCVYHMW